MPTPKNYIFVLWDDGFDESVATIFVTELRQAGLLVKVVGLTLRQTSGAHGLALLPDFSLDQALSLATQTVCLIIPGPVQRYHRPAHDPRLDQFFEGVGANQAHFVLNVLPNARAVTLGAFAPPPERVIPYPDRLEEIIQFAKELAMMLGGEQ